MLVEQPLKDIDQVQAILDKNDKAISKIIILQEHLKHSEKNQEEIKKRISLLKRCVLRRLRRVATWVDLSPVQKSNSQKKSVIMMQTRQALQVREKERRGEGKIIVESRGGNSSHRAPPVGSSQHNLASSYLPVTAPPAQQSRATQRPPMQHQIPSLEDKISPLNRFLSQSRPQSEATGNVRTRVPGEPQLSSKYMGVYHDGNNRWVAQFSFRSKQYYLGRYETEKEAAQIYKKACKYMRRFNKLILPRMNRASEVIDFSKEPPGKALVDGANYDCISSCSDDEGDRVKYGDMQARPIGAAFTEREMDELDNLFPEHRDMHGRDYLSSQVPRPLMTSNTASSGTFNTVPSLRSGDPNAPNKGYSPSIPSYTSPASFHNQLQQLRRSYQQDSTHQQQQPQSHEWRPEHNFDQYLSSNLRPPELNLTSRLHGGPVGSAQPPPQSQNLLGPNALQSVTEGVSSQYLLSQQRAPPPPYYGTGPPQQAPAQQFYSSNTQQQQTTRNPPQPLQDAPIFSLLTQRMEDERKRLQHSNRPFLGGVSNLDTSQSLYSQQRSMSTMPSFQNRPQLQVSGPSQEQHIGPLANVNIGATNPNQLFNINAPRSLQQTSNFATFNFEMPSENDKRHNDLH